MPIWMGHHWNCEHCGCSWNTRAAAYDCDHGGRIIVTSTPMGSTSLYNENGDIRRVRLFGERRRMMYQDETDTFEWTELKDSELLHKETNWKDRIGDINGKAD